MTKKPRSRHAGAMTKIGASALPVLRKHAQARLRSRPVTKPAAGIGTRDEVLYELRIHQAELEIQNEELRRAQFELAESRDHLSEIYEFSPVGYLTLDANGIIRNTNLTAAVLLGVEGGRLLGCRFSRYVAPGSQDAFFRHQRKLLAAGTKEHAEIELHCAGGSSHTIELQSVMLSAEAGSHHDWLMALVDVTERSVAERKVAALNQSLEQQIFSRTTALREVSEQYASIVRSVMDAIISVDKNGRVILFNLAAEQIFGRTSRSMLGRPIDCLIDPAFRKRYLEHFRLFMKTPANSRGMAAGRTFSAQRADGSVFPIEASISKVEVAGNVILTVIMRDISERKRAEQVQQRQEEAMTDFFAAAPLGLMWVGPDGTVQRVNQVGLDLVGCSVDAVIGASLERFYGGPSEVAPLLARLGQGETIRNFRLSLPEKNGKRRHLLIDANGYFDGTRLVHSRWFVRDITHRIQLEEEIIDISEHERERIGRDLHDDLCQELVAIEYQNASLVHAWAPAAPGLEDKGHEISKLIRNVIDRTRHLARGLTSNLESGPAGLMTSLHSLAERTGQVFGLPCRFNCPRPVLIRDRKVAVHLYRIAQEAVTNALKHSKATFVTIHLSSHDGTVVIGVEDNGIGLPDGPRQGGGAGLHIMQYRAGIIRGSLVIQRKEKGGVAVICTVRGVSTRRAAGAKPQKGQAVRRP